MKMKLDAMWGNRFATASVVLAGFLVCAGTAFGADFSLWSYRMKVGLPGYTQGGTLTNFPVLVVLNENLSGFRYKDFCSASGGDLRFTTMDGSELTYEVDNWDTNGSSSVWVKLPQLSGTNTCIYAYWGKMGVTAPAYTTNGSTWDANYLAVWHLNNGQIVDSTVNGFNGTMTGTVSTATGKAGQCASFPGGNNYLTCPDPNARLCASDGTVEHWLKPAAWHAGEDTTIAKDTVYNWADHNWAWAYGCNGTAGGYWYIVLNVDASCDLYYSYVLPPALNQWKYVAMYWHNPPGGDSETGLWGWSDGSGYGTWTWYGGPAAVDSTAPVYLGAQCPDRTDITSFNGLIDEVRISNVKRSPDWLWATWMNMTSNSVFNSYGGTELVKKGPVLFVD